MRLVSLVLTVFTLLVHGCATVEKSPQTPKVTEAKEVEPLEKFVSFTFGKELIIEGNTVCHMDEKTPERRCVSSVVHPQPSHLMLTLDDGKYQLIPAGRWVMYYHNNHKTEHSYIVNSVDGKSIGKCTVKLDRLTPTRVYVEECTYLGLTVSAVTKFDHSGKKISSIVGTIRKQGGVTRFVANWPTTEKVRE